MARYTIRVELLSTKRLEDDIYDKLHERMMAAHYWQKIQAGDGTWYNLPPAEYNSGELVEGWTIDKVESEVNDIANDVDRLGARVIVTEAKNRSWHLPESSFQGQPVLNDRATWR